MDPWDPSSPSLWHFWWFSFCSVLLILVFFITLWSFDVNYGFPFIFFTLQQQHLLSHIPCVVFRLSDLFLSLSGRAQRLDRYFDWGARYLLMSGSYGIQISPSSLCWNHPERRPAEHSDPGFGINCLSLYLFIRQTVDSMWRQHHTQLQWCLKPEEEGLPCCLQIRDKRNLLLLSPVEHIFMLFSLMLLLYIFFIHQVFLSCVL